MARKSKSRSDIASGFIVLAVGLALIVSNIAKTGLPGISKGGMALGGLIVLTVGIVQISEAILRARRLPKKEILKLAQSRQGLLTLGEITTALDLDPAVVKKTLEALSKDGLASIRWQEYRKNLWEFPDYMTLPISESLELAKSKGGRITENDLVATGHSRQTARQTLDALADKGLAQPDPTAAASTLIVTAN
jgi:hypothetical protein